MNDITVIKLNTRRVETWRYSGRVLRAGPGFVLLEAFFDRADIDLGGLVLAPGDRFVEAYYADRWYNIFEIYGREGLKGWYCNVTRPAEIEPGLIRYVDLALDLLVLPAGNQVLLDEDEFAALDISAEDRAGALFGLESLRAVFCQTPGFRLRAGE